MMKKSLTAFLFVFLAGTIFFTAINVMSQECVDSDCAPPWTSSDSVCSDNIMCATTTDYPGVCGVDGCEPPTVTTICDGPCGTHNECNAQQQCATVDGVGSDQCLSDTDCAVHSECNDQQQCISVAGAGSDQCLSDTDCANNTHNECNAQQQCIIVDGIDSDQCLTDDNCVSNAHNECNAQQQCVVINGLGPDQCLSDTDCDYCANNSHNECNTQQQCISVDGVGPDQCQSSADCSNNTHNECNTQKQCVVVDNFGDDQCLNDIDCWPFHNECNAQQQCVVVGGASPDQCQDDSQCIITSCPIGNHKECSGNICICVAGSGADLCQNDSQCIIDPVVNQPPYADQLASTSGSPCTGIQGTGMAFFQWRYQDIDPDDVEKKFILQIDDNSDFSSPEVYRTFDNLSYPPGTLNQQVVLVKTIPTETFGDFIGYNIDYYWRVMVQSQLPNGPVQSSDWAQAPATFKMTGHPAPSPEFTFMPSDPAPGESIDFSDVSVCYDNNGPAACASYLWNFGDSSPTSALQNPTHSYASANTSYDVGLTVCDEVNCCSIYHSVPVEIPGSGLPNWREISPF